VQCRLTFAQDHTHEATKNCHQKKKLGATALWDVSTDTGEIAAAVLVPSTKTTHFAHAAAALTRRKNFFPKAMYSDTWPVKCDFWNLLFKSKLEGRLGLFHYIQRITKTLKKNHTDHSMAIGGLLNCIYHYNVQDYENLLKALKEGTLSTKYSEEDVREMRGTKLFRQRHGSYLRKEIRPPNIMCSMLDDWFDRHKCSASDGSRPARGRRDPFTGETLFTAETKEAIRLGKQNAKYLQDPLPLDQMYHVIQPNPNSTHQLKEYLSRRGESSLESFHLMLAHFGNCGMRTTLVDNLNLTGTARHNLMIRHKLRLTGVTPGSRKKIPAACENILPFFNHSELAHVNTVAAAAGLSPQQLPFQNVEALPPDNGERFFSEYITWLNETKTKYDSESRCLCQVCDTVPLPGEQSQPQQNKIVNEKTSTPTPTPTPANTVVQRAPPEVNNKPTAEASPKIDSTTTDRVHQSANSVYPTVQVNGEQTLQQQHQLNSVMRQGWQAQPQQLHQHSTAHPMMMGYYSPQVFTPWIGTPYTFMAPAPSINFCCGRYRHWYNTPSRRGRPPHDDHCQRLLLRRMNQSGEGEKNRLDNPSGHVI